MPKEPQGAQRWLFRSPIWLYEHRLGWIMGGRFLMLRHTGRKSGLPRQAVVEVVRHDATANAYVICSGFGDQSQWYQNLIAEPDVTIQVRNRHIDVHAQQLTPGEGADEMVDYANRHPRAARRLGKFMGFAADGTEQSYRHIGSSLPFIRLSPR